MNPIEREQLRLALLRYCEEFQTSRFGLPTAFLHQRAVLDAWPTISRSEIENELGYLTGKGLVEAITKIVSPEALAWKITAAGRDLVALQMNR